VLGKSFAKKKTEPTSWLLAASAKELHKKPYLLRQKKYNSSFKPEHETEGVNFFFWKQRGSKHSHHISSGQK
jgi:hypothetical protein